MGAAVGVQGDIVAFALDSDLKKKCFLSKEKKPYRKGEMYPLTDHDEVVPVLAAALGRAVVLVAVVEDAGHAALLTLELRLFLALG